ncbi:hypothetical protein M427DRAFT_275088 [Gonapodya prolifera JEL478]|uniref:Uncharacterized protein n=1 Tax=Gonapodya prolifera (strain JEL478) TaxID=1344416 RepID=A0A139AY45_GONPJ|nr:hypothetical protein M427DRAFT_275088 [Gonapodya prolifera JEL478]|eukprot:KXS21624.1 hypothetical protein M427DRAFT_275088 [Gonapodya prolifera JEL478]
MALVGSRISLLSKSGIRYVGTLAHLDERESSLTLDNVRSFGTEGRRGGGADEIGGVDTVYEQIMFKGADISDITYLSDFDQPSQPPASQTSAQQPQAGQGPLAQPAQAGSPLATNGAKLGGLPGPAQRPQQQQFGFPPGPSFNPLAPPGFSPYGSPFPAFSPFGGMPPFGGPPPGPTQQQPFMNPYFLTQLAQQNPALWAQLQQQMQVMGMPGAEMPLGTPSQPAMTLPPLAGPSPAPANAVPGASPAQTSPVDDAAARLKALKVGDKPGPGPIGPAPVGSGTAPGGAGAEKQAGARVEAGPIGRKPEPVAAAPAPGAAGASVAPAPAGGKTDPIAVVIKKEPKAARGTTAGAGAGAGPVAPREEGAQQQHQGRKEHDAREGRVDGAKTATTLAEVVQGKVKPAANETIVVPPIPDGAPHRGRGYYRGPTGIPSRGGPPRGRGGGGPRGPPVPQVDYDFDSANRKFEEISKEIPGAVAASPVTSTADEVEEGELELDLDKAKAKGFYSKSGFFDDISCEAKDRQEDEAKGQRPNWREMHYRERRLNMETFGQAGAYTGGFRGGEFPG